MQQDRLFTIKGQNQGHKHLSDLCFLLKLNAYVRHLGASTGRHNRSTCPPSPPPCDFSEGGGHPLKLRKQEKAQAWSGGQVKDLESHKRPATLWVINN